MVPYGEVDPFLAKEYQKRIDFIDHYVVFEEKLNFKEVKLVDSSKLILTSLNKNLIEQLSKQ